MNDELTNEHEEFTQLRKVHCRQLPDQINAILSLWSELTVYPWTYDKAQQLLQLAHGLIGISDYVGALVLCQLAKDLDFQLQEIVKQATPPTKQQRKKLEKLVETLRQILEGTTLVGSKSLLIDSDSDVHKAVQQDGLLIYIVEHDAVLAKMLATELQHVGYQTQIFTDTQAFKKAFVDSKKPAAVVMSMVFPECEDAGAKVVESLRRDYYSTVPVIFVSERSDIEARLLALRAGAMHYLVKPFNINRLKRLLDEATLRAPLNPYRVLLVDDDLNLAEFHSVFLEEAGMVSYVLTDPLQTLNVIKIFNPDVIVLDIYMPNCSGFELAMMLNDDECFTEMPILFLSLEQDRKNQLTALTMGGDDFLSKPVDPQEFVRKVKLRARKGRHIRELHDDLRHALQALQYN